MDQVTVPRELLRQVLEALEHGLHFRKTGLGRPPEQYNPPAIDALRTALEQPAVEPFGYFHQADDPDECEFYLASESGDVSCERCVSLFTAPQAQPAPRKHITDGSTCWCNPETVYADPDTGASVIVHKEPQ